MITSLKIKLGYFDSNMVVLESQFAIMSYVSDLLREKLDEWEQYSHRPCLVLMVSEVGKMKPKRQ